MCSQFPFIPNLGYGRKAYGADGIVTTIGIVPTWEVWFQQSEHLFTPLNWPLIFQIMPASIQRVCSI
jgi:hypothetical protein